MRKAILLLLPLLSACGSKSVNSPTKMGLTRKDTPLRPPNCPENPAPNLHKLTVRFASGFPEKIALKLPGERDFRISDCARTEQTGMQLSWEKTGNRELAIVFVHNGAFTRNGVTTLPNDQPFEIFDMKSCAAGEAPLSFFKPASAPPVYWKVDYPAGALCAPRVIGEGSLTAALEELYAPMEAAVPPAEP